MPPCRFRCRTTADIRHWNRPRCSPYGILLADMPMAHCLFPAIFRDCLLPEK
ncbi:hypothetical protein STXM2123_5393 [Streptomyces sp. F-3]|nr:hypothetical protein STXM2123_5393 [Streptomyces sp. F-3]